MFEQLGLEQTETTANMIIKNLIYTVMNRSSVAEIIEDILTAIPQEIDEEQSSIVEVSAERLYSLQEPQVTLYIKFVWFCSKVFYRFQKRISMPVHVIQ